MRRRAGAGGRNADLAELAQLPVFGASRHYLRQVDAPASVSIVTAEDIRSFGYRTLGDILRSIRGINISNNHTYDYLAAARLCPSR